MQHVKFKDGSMEAARHSNDQDYYLFAINGDYAVVKFLDGNVWRSRTVNLVALEVATPLCVLPVKSETLKDARNRLIDEAATAAHGYASSCGVGPERIKAFDCYHEVLYSTRERG